MKRNNKMKDDWYEGAARELSFFMTHQIIKAYNNMAEKYGHTLYNVLFHSKDGVITMIRKKSELNKLVDYYESLSEKYIIYELKKATESYDELKKKLIGFELSANTWPELLVKCEEVWLYNMFGIYFGYATERKKINRIKEKNYNLVKKVRNEINDLQILDDFLSKCCVDFDLTKLTPNEIEVYLKNKIRPVASEIKERENEYLIFMKNLKHTHILKQYISQTLVEHMPERKYSDKTLLKGVTVFSKKVSGTARIILKKSDLSKIKEGDILVTIMTNPDFVPCLTKVAGMVTDFGGVTCHASIISREMKIPCIVGTKIATKVFKDGDLVEVDANKGIVRKLN